MESEEKCILCDKPNVDKTLQVDIPCCKDCHDKMCQQMIDYKEEQIKNNNLDPCVSEILTQKLYLGNEDAAYILKEMEQIKATHILIAGSFMKPRFQDKFQYKIIEVQDSLSSQLKPYFKECNQFIEDSKVVYVHCAAGINRSATFVIAYLMEKNKWSYEKTFNFVKERRSIIGRNPNFVNQLKEYQKELNINDDQTLLNY